MQSSLNNLLHLADVRAADIVVLHALLMSIPVHVIVVGGIGVHFGDRLSSYC